MSRPLSEEEILQLMSSGKGSGPRQDPTEPRNLTTWFKQNHITRVLGCENVDCMDIREPEDRGRNVVALVKGKHMCHFCYLGGWLSVAQNETANTSSPSN